MPNFPIKERMAGFQRELTSIANCVSARTALRVSAVALAIELAIAFTTYLPGAPLLPEYLPLLLFPGIFVVHFRSVILLSDKGSMGLRGLVRRVPWPAAVAFIGLFVGCWWLAGSATGQDRGQPTQRGGQYFLNDHGDFITVSHGEYLHAIVLSQRGFTLIPAVFFALGVLVNLAFLRNGDAGSPQPATN